MKYINKKTKVIIDSNMKIAGGSWVPVDEMGQEDVVKNQQTVEEEASVQDTDEVQENAEGIDGVTVSEIKQELDAMGIEYNPRAKKQELYDLMMSQGK